MDDFPWRNGCLACRHCVYEEVCFRSPSLCSKAKEYIGRGAETVSLGGPERFGLIEAQKGDPRAAEADAEAYEDNIMIPQFAELCKG